MLCSSICVPLAKGEGEGNVNEKINELLSYVQLRRYIEQHKRGKVIHCLWRYFRILVNFQLL